METYASEMVSLTMSISIVVFMYAAWSSVFSLGKMALELVCPCPDRVPDDPCRRRTPRLLSVPQAQRI